MIQSEQALQDALAALQAEYDDWLAHPFTKKITSFGAERGDIEKTRIIGGTPDVQEQARRDFGLFEGLSNGLWHLLTYKHFSGRLRAEYAAELKSVQDRNRAASGKSPAGRPPRVSIGL